MRSHRGVGRTRYPGRGASVRPCHCPRDRATDCRWNGRRGIFQPGCYRCVSRDGNGMSQPSKDTLEPMLEVSAVSYAYDGAVAVRNVSLAVGAGEIVTVLGSNGAGKTTT